MKNRYVSLLAVALFATVFAAGCGKHTKCADADGKGETYCHKKENFEDGLVCKWEPAASKKDADGKCKDTWEANAAAKAACEAVNTGAEVDMSKRQSQCESTAKAAATAADGSASCKWEADKCNVVKKSK